MNKEKQEVIDSLVLQLMEKPILLKSGNIIEFKKSNNKNEGEFIIDDLKTGICKIYFTEQLTLSLISDGSFKFTNFGINPVNTASIEGIDIMAIFETINLLTIK